MEALYILIPISIGFSFFFLIAFIWSVKTGQFDDYKKPPNQLLYEELEAYKEKTQIDR